MPTSDARSSSALGTRIAGAALSLGVAAIHVIDQGGIPGSKTPEYVGAGYWILEIVAILTALALIISRTRATWFVAIGVAAGPLIGYILSRGPGLPNYTDDKGNWTEPLGLVSLVVEAVLLILSTASIVRSPRPPQASSAS